ncbi:MAG: methionyl-tRNA formyltransferase [Saprospiraceae bacterium]|nr:methionyl-tRNA formyltransferase [Saprospiraceae bacterium]
MGTPEFAVPSLDILVRHGYNVVAVVTSMDSFGGRGGKQLIQSAVKIYAQSKEIPVLQPEKLKSPEFLATLKSYDADLQIVVAFRMLPEVVWNMPPKGTYNLHGSLLPKYRGAAPINWAIINGETETGVTSFRLRQEIDTGDVLFQDKIDILPDDTAGSLHDKMMLLGSETILKTVKAVESESVNFTKQDDALATKAPKIFHETCLINFNKSTREVYNFIRGLSPYPGAWTVIDGLETKIIGCKPEISTQPLIPGYIETNQKSYIKIACTDGFIQLQELKMQGKKQMPVKDFLNGYIVKNELSGV